MRTFLTFLIVFTATSVAVGQTRALDLNGFRLGQVRSATHAEFGAPDKEGAADENINYEAFVLNEEPLLYMIFQYQKDEPNVVWSIQITGEDSTHDFEFRGLRMGASPSDVEKVLGKPSRKINVQEHGTRWEFENVNYSVEINPKNRLSSVRIVDDRSKKPDVKLVPTFADVLKKLQSTSNAEMADLLAPDIEVYDGDNVRYFGRTMKREIASDTSAVFASVRRLSKELLTVDASKSDQYEENMRLRFGHDPLHVIQLWKLKGVREIAFRWNGEKWQIWEFGAKKAAPPNDDWKSIYKPGSLKEITSKRIPDLIKNPNVALSKDNGKPLAGFSYNSHPISAKVKFTGETRKTSEQVTSLISMWLTTIGKPKDLAKRFESEFKVIEDGVEYWLPIQTPIPERLTKEVKKDDEITIYLSWIGMHYEGDRPILLAIVNEFTIGK